MKRHDLFRLVGIFSLILFWACAVTTHLSAQCTGEVLNILASTHNTSGTTANWTVPSGGPYKVKITAKGAKGGAGGNYSGGAGANMAADFIVSSGQVFNAIAGAPGADLPGGDRSGGGGGGSGVQLQGGTALILAGGGGGGRERFFGFGSSGNVGQVNNNGNQGGSGGGGAGGGGFSSNGGNGNGGAAGGGGGFNGSGGAGTSTGGAGGGGFGGGGGSYSSLGAVGGGGGGGYSGGNGSDSGSGGDGGGSYNLGGNQNNTAGANNAGGQVIIECLGAATFTATVTPMQPICSAPTQGSLSIDLTGDNNGNTAGLEYAIVAGNSFTGTPTFANITADPFNITSGFGTTGDANGETYTVRIRLKYNPSLFLDYTYTLIARNGTIFVKQSASGANNGTSWANAFTDLQSALSAACSGAEIWVAAGTYKPTTGTDRNISFVMKDGVAIYGGFPNSGNPTFADRNWVTNVTTLSGDIGTVGVNSDNSYTVVLAHNGVNAATLSGFTVRDAFGSVIGGGIHIYNSSPTITQCSLINNSCTYYGGGISSEQSSPLISNCIFSGNYCKDYGGGIATGLSGGLAIVTNCLFINNSSDLAGGGIYIQGGVETITNCTFYNNTVPFFGGGVYSSTGSTSILKNCVLWGNSGGSFGTVTVTYSIVQGGHAGTGNLNADPLFVNAASGDLRLQACSPAIDAGSDAANTTTTDLDGNPRKFESIPGGQMIDMGAYEFQATVPNTVPGIWFVNASVSVSGSGRSWDCAFKDLQQALAAAGSGDQIWVAAGTYKPTTGTDRNISFVMKNGVAIYGGFNGTETQLSQRNWTANLTTLSGEIGAAGIADNTFRVINNNFSAGTPLTSSAILDGFNVEAGNANGGFPLNLGGGMWNAHASPTVRNCIFRNNTAAAGGAMFNDNSQASVTNCLFIGNSCTVAGAAMSNGGGTASAKVTNCTFFGNTGGNSTISNEGATAITNCIIWGNTTGVSGGTVTYSIVQGGFTGTGNLNADPLFVNAASGDFRLQQCSPAVDAGTNTNAPTTDFQGNVRPFNATGVSNTDMGAYEYQSTYNVCAACANTTGGIVYVNASATGSNNGGTWANAFTDLQSALTLARAYPTCVSQIWVAAGTYKPTSGTDRTINFRMVNGVAIYGGFPNTGNPGFGDRNWNTNLTTLSGDIGTVGVNSDNSFNVILNNNNGLNSTAVLNGFTITGGNANGTGNNASGSGMNNIGSSPQVLNCKFSGNSANFVGGGISNSAASPLIANCVFIGNSAVADGGAIFNSTSTSTIVNCSFYGNSSQVAAVGSNNNSSTIVTNCAFWNNNVISISWSSSSSTSVSYSISPQTYTGTGNLTADPLFVNAASGDLHLQACSPAIDAGSDAANTTTADLDGNPRKFESIPGGQMIDMGAYEFQATTPNPVPGVWFVNASVSVSGSGKSWVCAFKNLQQALAAAGSGDQIWVAAGTYKPTSSTDRTISFVMKNGVAIYGGFAGTETTLSQRNWATNVTILSGDIGTAGVNTDNSHRVINNNGGGLDNTAILNGFTIQDAYNPNTGAGSQGGGIRNINASPLFLNCIIRNNFSNQNGGGLFAQNASPTFVNCVFADNTARVFGGGVFVETGTFTFTNCVFYGNSSQSFNAGGLSSNLSSTSVFVSNSILWGNFWGSQPPSSSAQIEFSNVAPTLTHTIVQGGYSPCTNCPNSNGNADPLFVNAASGNLRLQACSPAIDAGSDSANNTTTDLGGSARKTDVYPGGAQIDLGAYEALSGDTQAPSITCPNDIPCVEATSPAGAVVFYSSPTATDNCDGNVPVNAVLPSGSTFFVGVNTVVATASDSKGNSAICAFTVQVCDRTPPTIQNMPNNISCVAATSPSGAVVTYTSPTATDIVAVTVPVTCLPASGSVFPIGSTTVVCTAMDAFGNMASSSFVVSVDGTPPTITCPANATVPAGANCTASLASYTAAATANDDCTANPTKVQSPVAGTTITGSQVVTLTATDGSNNSAVCTFTVTVVDQTAPSITCPANTTVPAGATCAASLASYTAAATANDNCTANPNKVQSPVSGTTITGSQVVTLNATDGANNSATCSFTVTVVDQTAPSITCPANTTVPAGATCAASLASYTAAATANDNCTANPNKVQSPVSGTTITGSQVVTLTATDGANNSATCSFTVTVVDQTAPSITCPANTTVPAGATCAASLASYTAAATANDNCTANPNKVQSPVSGTTITGSQVVTLTATDGANNSATCSFTVTVVDNTPPTVICKNFTANLNTTGTASITTANVFQSGSDNCGNVNLVNVVPNAFTCANIGARTVVLTVSDGSSNTATCSAIVTVADATVPTIICPANIIRANDLNQCSASVVYATPIASDNCAGAVANHFSGGVSGAVFQKGTTTVVWRATDGVGLTSSCSFSITINDTQKPNITCPANQTRSTDPGLCSAVVTYPTPTGTDNCGLPTGQPVWISGGTTPATSGANSIANFQKGINTVTWRATDGAGLTNTCTFRVTVNDNQAPTMTCPAAMNLFTATNTCSAMATYTNPTFTDNCAPTTGTAVRISGLVSGSAFPLGNSNVVFQATDAAGNTRRCTMVVTVTDNQPPVITCPAPVVVNGTGSPCVATVLYGSATASDNCAGTLIPFLVTGLASGSSFPAGVTTNTFRAVAPNGQSSSCSFSVTVNCGNGMGNTGTEVRDADLGIAQNSNLDLAIAPNPAMSNVTVSIEGVGAGGGTLLVFDAVGRLVLRQVIAENQRTAVFQVDDSVFAPGLYRVNLRATNGTVTKTLVVVKQ